jgi:predicted PurR-regulated permease PerM
MSQDETSTPSVAPLTGQPETETKAQPRLRIPDLLQKPFDVRSFALSGLFILAVFYTMYFMRSVLLPIVLALLLSYLLKPLLRGLGRWGVRPALGAAILLIAIIATVGYGVSFLAAPAAGWLEKAPYGLKQLQHKMLPLRKPMEQVAKASGEIDKLTAPDDAAAPTAVEVKRNRMSDVVYGRTQEFVVSTVLLLILLYFLLAYDEVFPGEGDQDDADAGGQETRRVHRARD